MLGCHPRSCSESTWVKMSQTFPAFLVQHLDGARHWHGCISAEWRNLMRQWLQSMKPPRCQSLSHLLWPWMLNPQPLITRHAASKPWYTVRTIAHMSVYMYIVYAYMYIYIICIHTDIDTSMYLMLLMLNFSLTTVIWLQVPYQSPSTCSCCAGAMRLCRH